MARRKSSKITLLTEDLEVSRRKVVGDTVKVEVKTAVRPESVEVVLNQETVEIVRVPVEREVEAIPAMREEDGVTIISVVEERVVIRKQLVLREEIHVRKLQLKKHFREEVELRSQEAVVTRDSEK